MNKSWTTALLFTLALTGCRTRGNVELLERELRDQEDEIYQMESMLGSCKSMLEASRRENEALKKELDSGDRGAAPSPRSSGSSSVPRSVAPPALELPPGLGEPSLPGGDPAAPPDVDGPTIEPGVPATPDDGGTLEAPPRTKSTSFGSEPADQRVTQIVLNRLLTGGLNRDGKFGADGITVVVEPRNAGGQMVKAAGDVSIVVLDPSKDGAAARVARWDFTANEAQGHYRRTPLARGMQFELPWPSTCPTNPTLHLFVRFVPADGRKLSADMTFQVDLADRQAQRWSSSTSDAGRGSSADLADQSSDGGGPNRDSGRPRMMPRLRQATRGRTGSTTAAPSTGSSKPSRQAAHPRRPGWAPNR